MDDSEVTIAGVRLACRHCGGAQFSTRSAQLNSAVLSFFDLEWANTSEEVYVCRRCGHLHWFVPVGPEVDRPERAAARTGVADPPTEDDLSAPTDCLSCGATIPAGAAVCPNCGWTYQADAPADVPAGPTP